MKYHIVDLSRRDTTEGAKRSERKRHRLVHELGECASPEDAQDLAVIWLVRTAATDLGRLGIKARQDLECGISRHEATGEEPVSGPLWLTFDMVSVPYAHFWLRDEAGTAYPLLRRDNHPWRLETITSTETST